jgi:prepilin-type N-terminal cleavage/methylation domain-containing protein
MITFKKTRGFTMVEMLMVMAILSLLVVMVSDFQAKVFSYNRIFIGGNFVGTDALNVVKSMATELRSMSPSSGGAYPIESAGTSSIVFFVDVDNDGIKERVRYYLNGTLVRRGVIRPAGNPLVYNSSAETFSTVMSNVRNTATSSLFTYYNTYYDGSATSSLPHPISVSSVRMIVINAILDADPSRPLVPLYATTQVSLRNLKDNL